MTQDALTSMIGGGPTSRFVMAPKTAAVLQLFASRKKGDEVKRLEVAFAGGWPYVQPPEDDAEDLREEVVRLRERDAWRTSNDRIDDAMDTVRLAMERDYGVVVATLPAGGYRLLLDSEVSAWVGQKRVERIRSEARRAQRSLSTQDLSKLTPQQVTERTAQLAILGVVSSLTREKSVKKIEVAIESSHSVEQAAARLLGSFTKKT